MIKADSRVVIEVCGYAHGDIGRVLDVHNGWASVRMETGAFYGILSDFPLEALRELDVNPRAADAGYVADALERVARQFGKAVEAMRRSAATSGEALEVFAAAFRRIAK